MAQRDTEKNLGKFADILRIDYDEKTSFKIIKENILRVIQEIVNDTLDAVDFNREWENFDPDRDELPQCIADHHCGKNISCLLCPDKLFGVCYPVMIRHIKELSGPYTENPDDDEKLKNKIYSDYLTEQVESIQIDRLFIYDYISSQNAFSEKKREIHKTRDIPDDNLNVLALFNLFVLKRMSTNGDE